jgi:hypothetical protein
VSFCKLIPAISCFETLIPNGYELRSNSQGQVVGTFRWSRPKAIAPRETPVARETLVIPPRPNGGRLCCGRESSGPFVEERGEHFESCSDLWFNGHAL